MPIDPAELRRLDEAATKGPLEGRALHPDWPMPADVCLYGVVSLTTGMETIRCWEAADAELYSYLRNHVFEILEALKARDRSEDRLREVAALFGIPDGGQYIADWKSRADVVSEALEDQKRMAAMEKRECWIGMKQAAGGEIKPIKIGGGLYSKSVRQCADELIAIDAAMKEGA